MDFILKVLNWLADRFFAYEKNRGGLKDFLSRPKKGKTQREIYEDLIDESKND